MLFAVGGAAQQAVWSEVIVVVGVDRLPAELLLQILGCGLLNEGVFVVGTHTTTSPFIRRGRRRSRAFLASLLWLDKATI